MKRTPSLQTHDGFSPLAKRLRDYFDALYEDPRATYRERFRFDPWHVPGQYHLLRTPAWEFFPRKLYEDFHTRLVMWGRENLGCHDVSPPWLSLYTDGHFQNLHGDLPHGPWAWVFSLTPWSKRRFEGGETLLLNEKILDYWTSFPGFQGLEADSIFQAQAPRFNRLTVFDPRIPHGVREVRGVRDPREGRLVIHGWFVNPRPFIKGRLRESQLEAGIRDILKALDAELPRGVRISGVLSLRFRVQSGRARQLKVLTHTLRSGHPQADALTSHICKTILTQVTGAEFPKTANGSVITLPLVFD